MRPFSSRKAAIAWALGVLAATGIAVAVFLAVREPPVKKVLCFGDSITEWYESTSWPALLLKQRPELQVVNAGVAGRTTVDGLAQFDEAFAAAGKDGAVTDVVILLGINDILLPQFDADETARRVREIAQKARDHGAREWILTPTPAIKIWLRPELPAAAFARDVGRSLLRMNEAGPRYRTLDLWTEMQSKVAWSTCSKNVHPDNEACRQIIADFVARSVRRSGDSPEG